MSSSTNAVSLDGDSSLPSWFKPARFLDVEFDADAYVSDLRRFVSEQLHRHDGSHALLVYFSLRSRSIAPCGHAQCRYRWRL